MTTPRIVLPIAFLLAAFAAVPAWATATVRVQGSVTLDGEPVAGAQIQILAVGSDKPVAKGKSKKNGTFGMQFFPPSDQGNYMFRAERDGMLMQSQTITVFKDREQQAEWTREIGAYQELSEFPVRSNQSLELQFEMVDADHFAKFLVIPGDRKASEQLAEASKLSGASRFEESDAILKELVAGGAETANVLYLLGRNAFSVGRSVEGKQYFERALAQNPDLPGIYGQLAVEAHKTGQLDQALDYFDKELAIQPTPVLQANRARVLGEMGRVDEAIEVLKRIVAENPDMTSSYGELAILYLNKGEATQATEVLEQMEQTGQPDPTLWYNIGANLSNRGEFEPAKRAYEKAIALNAGFVDAVRELGFLEIRAGDPAAALKHLQRYLEARPDAVDAASVRSIVAQLEKNAGS